MFKKLNYYRKEEGNSYFWACGDDGQGNILVASSEIKNSQTFTNNYIAM